MKFRAPWLYCFAIILFYSTALYLYRPPITHLALSSLVLSVFVSAGFWCLAWTFYCAVSHQPTRVAFSCIVGSFVSLLIVSTTLLYIEFGFFISRDMIEFVLDDPIYLVNYMQTYLPGPVGITIVLITVSVSWLWYQAPFVVIKPSVRSIGVGLVVLVCLIGSINHLRGADGRHHLALDTAFLVGLKHSFKSQEHERLYTSFHRTQVKPVSEAPSPNIVLIINESWSKIPLKLYGSGRDGPMKFLNRWFEKERDNFFVFRNAFTSSNATELSVPSIVTGVGAYQSNKVLHTMPLLWDWAAAAGYKSLFTSSQRLTWKQLREFLFIPGPSLYSDATDMDTPIVNDLGVDDLVAVERFKSLLQSFSKDTPWIAIHNTNALHPPFQQTSTRLEVQPNYSSRYDNALTIVDATIAEIYEQIEKKGQLDNTLFILTSDHCSGPMTNKVPRIASFYDESVNIPFIVRVPSAWLATHPQQANHLRLNQDRTVSNIDVVPTIIDLLGLGSANKATVKQLQGASLLGPIPTTRTAISINGNDTRRSIHEGFGIFREKKRFVFSTIEGAKLFDVENDPSQKNDLWLGVSEAEKNDWLNLIQRYHHLERIHSSHSILKSDE